MLRKLTANDIGHKKVKSGFAPFRGIVCGGIIRQFVRKRAWKSGKMPLMLCEETVKQTGLNMVVLHVFTYNIVRG
jgi:hypothetical protein